MKQATLQNNTPKLFTVLSYKKNPALYNDMISALLVLLFMYASVSKLLDYDNFKLQLSKSPFISNFSSVIAWALPAGEILISLALTHYKLRIWGLYGSVFLMTMFTAYIYAMLHFSYYLPCSCGGILSKMDWHTHFWFNLAFLLLSILGIFLQNNLSTKNISQ